MRSNAKVQTWRIAACSASRATLARGVLVLGLCAGLTACEKERPPPNVALLSADIHVAVAGHHLVLPFIALENYHQGQSFSLNRERDASNAADAVQTLMRESQAPLAPKPFDRLRVRIQTYGWNDFDMRQRAMCPMLTRQWARSACDNPWSAVQQALPGNFELADLSRLDMDDDRDCSKYSTYRREFPAQPGNATVVCEIRRSGGGRGQYHVAAVRIDGDLGAIWVVNYEHFSPTPDAMTIRQGKAIVAFVRHGIGPKEDASILHDTLCQLKKPDADPGLKPDCPDTVQSAPRHQS